MTGNPHQCEARAGCEVSKRAFFAMSKLNAKNRPTRHFSPHPWGATLFPLIRDSGTISLLPPAPPAAYR